MRFFLKHIIPVLALIVVLFASCSKDEAKLIPRKKMAKIYAEMLVTDQWITNTPGIRLIADTSLVYEPILKKYGYDSEDYRKSVDVYMNDPERFSRIFRTTGAILENRLKDLKQQQAIQDAIENLPKIQAEFNIGELSPYLAGEPYIHYYDSLDIKIDPQTKMYRLTSIERSDTIYDNLRMIIVDSLAVADSLARLDSLNLADSLKKVQKIDSIRAVRKNRLNSMRPAGRNKVPIPHER